MEIECPIYEELILESIYDSINLRMHSLDSYFKYDFIIELLRCKSNLIDYKHISPFIRNGNLILDIGFNETIEQKPEHFKFTKVILYF